MVRPTFSYRRRPSTLRAGAVALLVCLGMGIGGSVPGVGIGSAAHGPADGPSVRSTPRPLTVPNASQISELGNFAGANGSFRPGDLLGPNGYAPTSIAYDGLDHLLYVGVAQPTPGVLVVNPLYGDAVGFWPVGGGPLSVPEGLTFDPDNGRLIVADGGAGNVTLFDTVTGDLVGTTRLGLGTDPVAVAVDPGADRAIVAEAQSDVVAVLNATTGAPLGASAVGPGPDAVAFDPVDGSMVVANGGGSTVSLVDPINGTVLGSEPVGNGPDGVAYESVQGRVLVANLRSANVSILGPGALVPNGSYGTGVGPEALACTIDGQAIVPNGGDDNVTVLDDDTNSTGVSLAAGADPIAAVWDATLGEGFVVDAGSDNLTILNVTVSGVVGSEVLGSSPGAAVDLPTVGEFAVADPGAQALEEYDLSGPSEAARVALPSDPSGLAYDPSLGTLFATEPSGVHVDGNVTAVNASLGRIVATYPVGMDPQGIVFDPATGELYVEDYGNASVAVLDPVDGALNATFHFAGPGGGRPGAGGLAVDPNGSRLYIAGQPSYARVIVLDARTGRTIANVTTPGDPVDIATDPSNGSLWVTEPTLGMISEINGSTDVVTSSLTFDAAPTDLAFDGSTGWLVVPFATSAQVAIVNASNGSLLAEIGVPPAPTGVAVEASANEFAVTDPVGGDVALLGPAPAVFPVEFQESGLPNVSAGWTVDVDGVPWTSRTGLVVAEEPNGSHAFLVPPVPPLVPTPASGTVQVAGSGQYEIIVFGPPTYNATFFEVGLPTDTVWTVGILGSNYSSGTDEIDVPVPNGTYAYSASTGLEYSATGGSGSGNLTVDGVAPTPTVVHFAPSAPFEVTFTEAGLSNGTEWTVDLGAVARFGTGATIVFPVGAGTFSYSIPPVGAETAVPNRGAVTVAGRSPSPIDVRFAPSEGSLYPVVFRSAGLPAGVAFTVILAGTPRTGVGVVNFTEPNGSYDYAVEAPDGYAASPASGSIQVAGEENSTPIQFGATGTTGVTSPFPAALVVDVAVVLGAVLVVVGVVLWYRRRRPPLPRLTGELVRPAAPGERPGDPELAEAPEVVDLPPE